MVGGCAGEQAVAHELEDSLPGLSCRGAAHGSGREIYQTNVWYVKRQAKGHFQADPGAVAARAR